MGRGSTLDNINTLLKQTILRRWLIAWRDPHVVVPQPAGPDLGARWRLGEPTELGQELWQPHWFEAEQPRRARRAEFTNPPLLVLSVHRAGALLGPLVVEVVVQQHRVFGATAGGAGETANVVPGAGPAPITLPSFGDVTSVPHTVMGHGAALPLRLR